MQQRRLRLGDILDDYCPRERRITNHAVVAKIDDEVRQTRCLTCDTEHEYRQGKAPTLRKKKKDNVSAAYREVLAEVTKGVPGVAPAEPEPGSAAEEASPDAGAAAPSEAPEVVVEAAPEPAALAPGPAAPAIELAASAEAAPADAREPGRAEPASGAEGPEVEEGRVHRRLIRATLPRPDNQPVTRPIPQFTMRQPTARAAKFRPSPGRGPRPAAGARVGVAGAGRGFPTRGGAPHTGRTVRADVQRSRGAHPPRGKKHSK